MGPHTRPPVIALWLIERFGNRYRNEALAGDFMEEFSARRSRTWVWAQVLRALASRINLYWREYRGALAFLLLMTGFRSAWADWVYVPTGSMNPTVIEGDRLLIDKHSFGLRIPFTLVHLTPGEDPQRGDIVTLKSPADGTLLLKRIVAVPGDTVALDDEHLIVNGVRAEYEAGDSSKLDELLAATRRSDPEILREFSRGAPHDILLLPGRPAPATFGPLTLPKEMYFVLGDNRDNSADSRYIGLVPRRNIIGKATRILFSLDGDKHELPRAGRFLESLR